MTQWTRETPWRQGCVLQESTASALGLVSIEDPLRTCVMVISHDCDLANGNLDAEPDVEIIIGRTIDKAEGNHEWGKSPRTLHVLVENDGGKQAVELVATQKRTISKSTLAIHEPDDAFSLDEVGLNVLRSWLSSRYDRAAFPDAFVNRMKHNDADKRLARALKEFGTDISFVFFRLEGGNVERPEGDPYLLDVVLVYPVGDDAERALDNAEKAVEKIEQVLQGRLTDPYAISLSKCITLSEEDITVAQARLLQQWRLEYMTLSSDEEQPGPPQH